MVRRVKYAAAGAVVLTQHLWAPREFFPAHREATRRPARPQVGAIWLSPRPDIHPDKRGEAAFIGIVGEIVAAVAPISEADSAALLVWLLVAFGNAVGKGWLSRAEADRHGLNLFALIVGDTTKGRKGTSWGKFALLCARLNQHGASKRYTTASRLPKGSFRSFRMSQWDRTQDRTLCAFLIPSPADEMV